MFYRTSTPGTIITTWHPDGGGAPTIRRSTTYGASFTDVVAAQTNVEYLGPTSICQDPVTGFLYLGEYVSASAATTPTFKISKSIDDGATWTTFKTFSRDAFANPTTAVRHCHGIQWDQHSSRMYFLTGDNEDASGIYRLNADGTDLEPILTKVSQSALSMVATCSRDYVLPELYCLGPRRNGRAWLVRMNRDQIGATTPVVERVAHLQSTSWYTVRTKTDGTEWLMCSNAAYWQTFPHWTSLCTCTGLLMTALVVTRLPRYQQHRRRKRGISGLLELHCSLMLMDLFGLARISTTHLRLKPPQHHTSGSNLRFPLGGDAALDSS